MCPKVRTNMGKLSIRTSGPKVRSRMVPDNIKHSPNINIFKERIKSWVPQNYDSNLRKDWMDGVRFWKITE